MEDGQDHRDGAELESGFAPMPVAEPVREPASGPVEEVFQPAAPDDVDDSSLTGVLAALQERDPDVGAEAPGPQDVAVEDTVVPVVEPVAQPDSAQPDTAQAGAEQEQAAPAEAPAPQAVPVLDAPAAAVAAPAVSAEVRSAAFAEPQRGVPIWPFLVYFSLWVVFAGLLMWQFVQTPAGVPLYELALYGPSVLAGLVLTALGPLLAIGVWMVLWLARPGARAGLFSRSLILGAVVTLAGVALWLVALGAVDMLRLGRLV